MGNLDPDRVRFTGPLEPFAPGLREELARLGYARTSATTLLQLAAHLSRWLGASGVGLGGLTGPVIDRFLVERHDDPTHELGAAWGIKEQLRRLLRTSLLADAHEAKMLLGYYVQVAHMLETDRLWNTICEWWPEIEVLIVTGVTNARTEAANTSIKNIKRPSRLQKPRQLQSPHPAAQRRERRENLPSRNVHHEPRRAVNWSSTNHIVPGQERFSVHQQGPMPPRRESARLDGLPEHEGRGNEP